MQPTLKYSNFALRLLKQCASQLPDTRDPRKRAILLNLSDQCCKTLQTVHGVSGNFAKLLLHLAEACIAVDEVTLGISYCDLLHSELTAAEVESGNGLLKYVFHILSHAGNVLAREGSSREDVLGVRKRALQSLLACCQTISVLEHVMKAEYLFLGCTSPPTLPHQVCTLHSFHTNLISTTTKMFDSPISCDQFATVARYLHHRVMLATRAEQASEGKELLHVYAGVIGRHRTVCEGSALWCQPQEEVLRASLKVSHPFNRWSSVIFRLRKAVSGTDTGFLFPGRRNGIHKQCTCFLLPFPPRMS